MTERRTDFFFNPSRARLTIVCALLGTAACSETIGEGPASPQDNRAGGGMPKLQAQRHTAHAARQDHTEQET